MTRNFRIEERDGIAVVTISRPPANALDIQATEEVADIFAGLANRPSLRAVVLTGEGTSFCAGLDLKQVPSYDLKDQDRLVDALNRAYFNVYRLPCPVIGAINGHAIAGGMVLALCTDLRIAVDGDYLVGVTEVRAGIPYPVSAIEVCRAEMSKPDFRKLVLFGKNTSPQNAQSMGLFDELIDRNELMKRAQAAATEMAEMPKAGFAKIKQQSRQAALCRMEQAVRERKDPLFGEWLSEETISAATSVLRGDA